VFRCYLSAQDNKRIQPIPEACVGNTFGNETKFMFGEWSTFIRSIFRNKFKTEYNFIIASNSPINLSVSEEFM
jgi:hypothetical protein